MSLRRKLNDALEEVLFPTLSTNLHDEEIYFCIDKIMEKLDDKGVFDSDEESPVFDDTDDDE